jgi:hypothetical protein
MKTLAKVAVAVLLVGVAAAILLFIVCRRDVAVPAARLDPPGPFDPASDAMLLNLRLDEQDMAEADEDQ